MKNKPSKTSISKLNPKIDATVTKEEKEFNQSIEQTNQVLYKRIKLNLKKKD